MGLFNNSHMLLGTEACGDGHGDMRNAGGMHAKMARHANKNKNKTNGPEGGLDYDAFVKQKAAEKITKAAKQSPLLKKVKGRTVHSNGAVAHAGKVAPMIDSGNGRKTRMVIGVRCRPLSSKEHAKGSHNCLEIEDGQTVYANDPDDKMGGLDYLRLNVTKDKTYYYDHAFGPESTSEEVYQKCMKGVVRAVMSGFHGSCFAYGATGSGKTFTMAGNEAAPGVMPRAINDLFVIAKQEDDFQWKFSLTYVEIYNERIKDLLNPSEKDLDVREDPKKGNVVAGAVEVAVSSLQQIMELMERGSMYRTTESTNCNDVSSRSHAVMQINCIGIDKYQERVRGKQLKQQAARLSMIDLAGSERAYKTDNRGERLREGRNINRSLLSLANCINALADKSKKNQHVPYRDSKLTRLLRDSLSGTSVSAMLCAVSPSSDQFEETLNTLKYANRAKSMTPPDGLKKQTRSYDPVDEKVEVLKDLKESIIQMAKKMTPAKAPAQGRQSLAGREPIEKVPKKVSEPKKEERVEKRATKKDEGARREKKSSKGSRAASREPSPARTESTDGGEEEDEVAERPARRLSTQGEAAVGMAKDAEAGNADVAEVRKVLEELIEQEPEAKTNPAVQAAYVALDNMEAEEVEAISAEGALLWKEQQNLEKDLAKAKHAHKIASVRLGWYDAAPQHVDETDLPGEERVGGGKEALDELLERVAIEETNVSRLQGELKENKAAIASLQSEVPERIVSSNRLSQLKLTSKHQQAATDALKFKQQARSMAGVLGEMLTVWGAAIPEDVQAQIREVCDLDGFSAKSAAAEGAKTPAPAKRHKVSIDTLRRKTLESARGGAVAEEEAPAKLEEANTHYDNDEDDEDDEDDEPHVLDGAGNAAPWRNLGALAKQATSKDNDDEEEDAEGAKVMRKAKQELQDQRAKRKTVMKLVEEAATPADAGVRKQARAHLGAAAGEAAAKQPAAREARTYSDSPTVESVYSDENTPSQASTMSFDSERQGKKKATKVGSRPPSQPSSARSTRAAPAKGAALKPRATAKA